ncbi:MAG: Crp/Fnr family transcriptional regulator [Nitrospirota bacterium]
MSEEGFLKGIVIFNGLKEKELQIISKLFVERFLKKWGLITSQGDAADSLYLVKEGNVKITKLTIDGREKIASLLKEGDFFGEVCILMGKERCINARAITDCKLLTLSRENVMTIMEEIPQVAINFINILCSRLAEAEHQIDALLFKNPREIISDQLYELSKRYGVHLKDTLLIDLRLTQQVLADMVGLSRETVSRGIKELRRDGIIKDVKDKKYILDISPFKAVGKYS